MTNQLELPDGWEWSDYNTPTARRKDGRALIDSTQGGTKFRTMGQIPDGVRAQFHVRRAEVHADQPRCIAERPECPFDALELITAHWSGDWGAEERLAWMYGIVSGWDTDSLRQLARQHHWDPNTVARLCRQRATFVRCMERQQGDAAQVVLDRQEARRDAGYRP